MLIYATSKCFPRKTFVLTAKPKHTIARVRAQLLHLLYEFGREDHQFRLRFDGKELKDSLTLDDYHIMNNAVFKMIPMSKDNDSLFDLDSLPSDFTEDISENTGGVYGSTKAALLQEINILNRRQVMTATFHGFLSMHFVGVICSLVTSHWYTFSYHLLIYILSSYYAPQYSRLGGFTGNYTIPPKVYCILFAIVMTLVAAASTTLSALKWISVIVSHCT
ncbi:hypothetical protein EB796_024049 [Bugula neritina]|uniref:Ubiquitin-like domain-containing protein n=1 Tax=Bugula neritina TaxID=10212 RepID=A0A7J7IUP4_BUGNE|nr:hypothetical protein EB796_024049 [Bugula neritina]